MPLVPRGRILDPRARWVPRLGPVGTPDPMGISTKGYLYTYIHTYIHNQPMCSSFSFLYSYSKLLLPQSSSSSSSYSRLLAITDARVETNDKLCSVLRIQTENVAKESEEFTQKAVEDLAKHDADVKQVKKSTNKNKNCSRTPVLARNFSTKKITKCLW